MLRVDYECPECGHRWAENLECGQDGECPECGQGDVVAEGWTQLTPEQEAEAQRPKPWLVSRTVLECLFIEARNEREAIEAAIGIEAGWTRSIDREDYDCTPPPAGGFILGLPIV